MYSKARKRVRLLAGCVDLQRKPNLFRRPDPGIHPHPVSNESSHRIVEWRDWMAYNSYDNPQFVQRVADFRASRSQLWKR